MIFVTLWHLIGSFFLSLISITFEIIKRCVLGPHFVGESSLNMRIEPGVT